MLPFWLSCKAFASTVSCDLYIKNGENLKKLRCCLGLKKRESKSKADCTLLVNLN